MEAALTISFSSLVVGFVTLFFAHLRPPKIETKIGPNIEIYYTDYALGAAFGIYVPTTFINLSNRTGTILKSGIIIHREDSPDQRFFMQWREFASDSDRKWTPKGTAHALAVPGKSSQSRRIWFIWQADTMPKLFLREGQYIVTFLFWDRPKRHPNIVEHRFFISDTLLNRLEGFRREEKSLTVSITLDQEFAPNRLLTGHEAKALFHV